MDRDIAAPNQGMKAEGIRVFVGGLKPPPAVPDRSAPSLTETSSSPMAPILKQTSTSAGSGCSISRT
ncbi:hypothetical protein SAMN04487974_104287 [Pelagibacterium luteolum]|uniref:Uncharacterized protein n=1 Tax=Pelagibacterium luteolum TaxID=440168 RepID=A0A1G7VQX0_9HYPH|nr:hypothetical protein SAMN04487974_104287 [Pelagibacterium luteolum]